MFTVMTYNVGNGLAGAPDLVSYLRKADADFVGRQELTATQAEAIAGNLGDVYPYRALFGTGIPGKGVLSRYPLVETRQLHLSPARPELRAVVDSAAVTRRRPSHRPRDDRPAQVPCGPCDRSGAGGVAGRFQHDGSQRRSCAAHRGGPVRCLSAGRHRARIHVARTTRPLGTYESRVGMATDAFSACGLYLAHHATSRH